MLTPKQENFAREIVKGNSQADAYRSAYSCKKMSDKTIWENASRLMADSKVKARVQELQEQLNKSTIMTAQERLEWLTELIKNTNEGTTDRLRAIDLMNKMQGEYVQRVEATVDTDISINIELSDD